MCVQRNVHTLAKLTERVVPQQRLCVLPHGAVVLVVGVDGSAEGPSGGVRSRCQRRCGMVRQCRVDRCGFINRCPVRWDETCKGGVGRRKSRCGDERSGAGGGGRGGRRRRGGGGGVPSQNVLDVEGCRVSRLDGSRCVKRDAHGAFSRRCALELS